MEEWILETIDAYGYMGIFLLVALENLFPPIPSEVILTFGGFFTTETSLTVEGVIAASTLGSLVGALILYGVGALFPVARLEGWVERWGGWLKLKPSDLHRTNDWFTRYGSWAVFFGRFIPLIRSLISIPAGITRLNLTRFLVLTTAGTIIWNTALVLLGAWIGDSWERVVEVMDVYSNALYALLAAGCAVVLWFWIRRMMKK